MNVDAKAKLTLALRSYFRKTNVDQQIINSLQLGKNPTKSNSSNNDKKHNLKR